MWPASVASRYMRPRRFSRMQLKLAAWRTVLHKFVNVPYSFFPHICWGMGLLISRIGRRGDAKGASESMESIDRPRECFFRGGLAATGTLMWLVLKPDAATCSRFGHELFSLRAQPLAEFIRLECATRSILPAS